MAVIERNRERHPAVKPAAPNNIATIAIANKLPNSDIKKQDNLQRFGAMNSHYCISKYCMVIKDKNLAKNSS